MHLTSRVRISDDVHSTLTGDTAVLMDLRSGDYLGLDRVGTRIWQLTAELGAVERVVERVVGHYRVERARAEADVLGFLEECRREGLLSVAE